MIGKTQSLSPSRTDTHPVASLPIVRLTSAIALGLALAYAPAGLHAQDASQGAQGTSPATASAAQSGAATSKAGSKSAKGKTDDKTTTGDGRDTQNLAGIVVTGIRASLESSQSLKQNADQIVDSVTATDINALPDRSVTETLQRISGVTVDHYLADDDPDHPSAEGSGVLIRGLPYVASLLNGAESFSANNGRALSFEDVPAELMQGVDVYKNPSAELIEGGIGGTVDLRTRMPFDAPGEVAGFSYGVNEGDMSKHGKPSTSFLYSNRWKTDNLGEFGALFDVSYSGLASRTDGIQTNPYVLEPANNLGGCPCEPTSSKGNVAIPGDINYYDMDMRRRRIGLYAAFQWRPTDNLEFDSRFFRSSYNLQWQEHEVQANEGNYYNMIPVPGTSFDYNGDGIYEDGDMVSGSWQGGGTGPAKATLHTGWPPIGGPNYYALTREQTQFVRTTDWSTTFKYNLTDDMIWSGAVQFIKSTANSLDFTVYNQFYMPPSNVNMSSGIPSLTPLNNITYAYVPSNTTNPGSLTNYSNYYVGAALDHLEYDYAMERAVRTDLEYNFQDSNWLQYLRVGVRFTNHDTYSNNNGSSYNWGPISQVWEGGYTGPSSLAWANNAPSWMEQQFNFSDFFRGKTKLPSTLVFPSMALVGNYYGAISALRALEMSGGAGGWCPQFYSKAEGDPCNPSTGMSANYMRESTQAAYASLHFGNDTALGIPVDGNIGVRFVRTSVSANGTVTYPTSGSIQNTLGITPAEMALFNGMTTPVSGAADYHDVLPSLNLRFKLTDDLQLRLAASKAMTRPTISQLNSYMVIGTSWSAAGTGQQAKFAGFTASTAGNPGLKPLKANQFDVALEWYFAPAGELYTTLFKKNLSNYTTTEVHSQTIDGVPVAVRGPTNAGSGTIKGAELGYSQFFNFLPGPLKGLGVQANYTFLQSSKVFGTTSCDPNHGNGSCSSGDVVTNPGLPMQGLSAHNYNITGMYEYGDWSARLAWSWRSRYLITPVDSGDTYLPMWNAASGELDASIFYHVNKNIQVGLQANNLTNTVQKVLMGPTTYVNGYVDWNLYTRALFMTDRRYELVFRANF